MKPKTKGLQMRLLLFTIWDLFLWMCNDIRAGVLAAKWQRFLLFAYNACNACFGPWNTHANFDTKKAWFSAWLSSSCASSQWFLEYLHELAHDRGIPVPVSEASVKYFRVVERVHIFVCDRGATSNDVLVQLKYQHQVFVAKFHAEPARSLV